MKKLKKRNLILALFSLLVCTFLIWNGFSVGIFGKFFFGTEGYDSATEAFAKAVKEDISIQEQIDVLNVDNYNGLLLAVTEHDELIVASMTMKGEKYTFTGEYYIYDKESSGDYSENTGLIANKTSLYSENGIAEDCYQWCILFDKQVTPDSVIDQFYKPIHYKEFRFVLL